MKRPFALLAALATSVATVVLAVPAAAGDTVTELVPGTAVLLNQSSSGGGGNGGNTKVASSATNIFAPSVHLVYNPLPGAPSDAVDRYPLPGVRTELQFQCPAGQTTCFKDIV